MKKRFTEEQVQLYRTGVKLKQVFFRPRKPADNCFIELKELTPSQFKTKPQRSEKLFLNLVIFRGRTTIFYTHDFFYEKSLSRIINNYFN